MSRKAYPTDVSDEEWQFVAPYLTLLREDATQRVYALRELFDAVRSLVKAGCPWRLLPNDLPPWTAVHQQAERWRKAGCFEAMVHDLRELLRFLQERNPRPSAAVLDGRTLQSSPESGGRAGDDGYKRKKGSKVHVAVDTLGHLLALLVTSANEQERAQVAKLTKQVQEATHRSVRLAYVDQGSTRTKNLPPKPRPTASSWRSSSSPRPSVASCCCPDAGWSSAPLLGWHAFAVSRVTTNGFLPRWPDCTGWLLPAFCSATCSKH